MILYCSIGGRQCQPSLMRTWPQFIKASIQSQVLLFIEVSGCIASPTCRSKEKGPFPVSDTYRTTYFSSHSLNLACFAGSHPSLVRIRSARTRLRCLDVRSGFVTSVLPQAYYTLSSCCHLPSQPHSSNLGPGSMNTERHNLVLLNHTIVSNES